MEKQWTLILDHYSGLSKQAANFLSGFVSGFLEQVLTVANQDTHGGNRILLGRLSTHPALARYAQMGLLEVPRQAEGYSIYVGEDPLAAGAQLIAIAGFDEAGVLYGVMDFCNRYCGDTIYQGGYLYSNALFTAPFDRPLPTWRRSCAPAIATRAVWTWGHVIYDYRGFFTNMARLRLNEVVIWNDHVPLNAGDVVAYAHSLGIRVIWGFAWGWDTGCDAVLNAMDAAARQKLKETILQTYRQQYAGCGDGIYFQSFTELSQDRVNGICIADAVTELVNDVAGTLLEAQPDLHIQFGLHATSVREHLDALRQVDPRVHIVWEDCGAFPYHYSPRQTADFPETLALTRQLLTLRGPEERFGAVLKGMLNLDWQRFSHFSGPYILGERTQRFLRTRRAEKDRIWKIVQAGWLRNLGLVQKTVSCIAREGNAPIVQALIEDGMLEQQIPLPAVLLAELLWEPDSDVDALLETCAKFPCVQFANL